MAELKLGWPSWIGVVAEEMATRGVEQVTGIEGGIESHEYWCYFRDPEGNLFEITQPL
ncbi:MAG TPA: hypothetical protein VEN82_07870 [Actinomycetota bacterium]|nr:hypothetical protein [Actinomycetota bacterium]